MTHEKIIEALQAYITLAVELVPSAEGRVAWAAIYHVDPTLQSDLPLLEMHGVDASTDSPIYHIRLFEIPRAIADTWFGEDDMLNKQGGLVVGDDALFAELTALKVPVERLAPARDTEYPL